MKSVPVTAVLAALLAPLTAPAQPASDTTAALEKCADITSDADRLACFDQLARANGGDSAAPAPDSTRPADAQDGAAPKTAAGATASPNRDPAPGAAASAPAADSPAPTPPAPATPSAGDNADEGTATATATGAEEDSEGEFTAVVSRIATQPRGEHVVFLENGQVWQENFASRYFPVEAGDTVTIKERFFGGHRLVTSSGKGIRVKRIQ